MSSCPPKTSIKNSKIKKPVLECGVKYIGKKGKRRIFPREEKFDTTTKNIKIVKPPIKKK